MSRQVYVLSHDTARQNAARAVLEAPEGFMVRIEPRTRTLDQNAMLHALFSTIAKQATWCGRQLSAEQWKVLFISGHAIATGRGSDMIPGLEGEFVNIRESSARMSVARMTSLIEYIIAWCAERGIDTSGAQSQYGFAPTESSEATT